MEILLVALAVTFAAAPLVRRMLLRRGVLDIPNSRSSHAAPVPRGGGIACVAGAAVAVTVGAAEHRPTEWVALGGVGALAAVGFLDDRGGLRAVQRLAVQALVGAAVGGAVGGASWAVAGALLLPVTVNAVNFMDGINGITALNMVVWGLTAMFAGRSTGALVVLGAVAAGTALGFLPWNAPTARLFLGDTGSYFFGGLVGIGILLGARQEARPLLVAVPLAVYLADTGVTLVRRARRRAPLMTAHRDHAYQRLVDGAMLAHLPVATLTAAIAAVVTLAWALLPVAVAASVTAVALVGYLASPGPLSRSRAAHASVDGTVR